MKILHITVRADWGGGPRNLYNSISAHPATVADYVAAPRDIPFWKRFTELLGEDRLLEIPHRKFSVLALARLIAFVQSNGIEIIHSHGRGGGVYGRLTARLTGRPCIHTWHGLQASMGTGRSRALRLWVERTLSRYTEILIAVSETEKQFARAAGVASTSKTRTVLNGIANGLVSPPKARAWKRPLRILSITRMSEEKRPHDVVGIAEALRCRCGPDAFEWVLLGDGPLRASLQAAVASRGLENCVQFHGAVNEPREYMDGAFALLATSPCEGLPLALLEAMSEGLPVVASAAPGHIDVVENNQTGFLYEIENADQAADLLWAMAGDPQLWDHIAAKSWAVARQRFGLARQVRELVECYDQTLLATSPASR